MIRYEHVEDYCLSVSLFSVLLWSSALSWTLADRTIPTLGNLASVFLAWLLVVAVVPLVVAGGEGGLLGLLSFDKARSFYRSLV